MTSFDPTRFPVDDAAVQREAAETVWRDKAVVKVVIEDAKVEVATGTGKDYEGCYILKGRLGVINPDDGASRITGGPYANLWVCLPSPGANGETPPEWAGNMWAGFCEGFLGEHYPAKPVQQGGKWFYEDAEIEPGQLASIKLARAALRLKLSQWVIENKGANLVRSFFSVAKVKNSTKGDDRQNFEFLPDLPKNQGYTAADDILVKSDVAASTSGTSKSNGKSGKATAAKTPKKRRRA